MKKLLLKNWAFLLMIIFAITIWQKKQNKKETMKNNYKIIYLNGASSCGKSTLARALQNHFEEPFLVLGIDQIIYMMPEKMNDWHHETLAPGFSWQPVKNESGQITAYKIHTGPYGIKMIQTLKDMVTALAPTNNIIIDDVSFGKEQVDQWRKTLHNFNVLWIGVTAPREIIEKREKERGDRKLGSAQWQAERVHTDVVYDVTIDTHHQNLTENIDLISKHLAQKYPF